MVQLIADLDIKLDVPAIAREVLKKWDEFIAQLSSPVLQPALRAYPTEADGYALRAGRQIELLLTH